jgi:isoleucyl-tRNA synthetase
LGSAARNSVTIKVRQPLAEMRVQPGNERERRAVERFGDQICEELNIKVVKLHENPNEPLLTPEVKPNLKTLGPKFGAKIKEVTAALAEAVKIKRGAGLPIAVAQALAGQPIELSGGITLDPSDVYVQFRAADGWTGVADGAAQVAIDTRITEELAQEGMAREVVRHIQDHRKKSGLEIEERIKLSLCTDSPRLQQAIKAHQEYIRTETLALELVVCEPLEGESFKAEVKVDGQALTIGLRKV